MPGKNLLDNMKKLKGLPDMVFVCNSGLAYRNGVYLSRFKHKERRGEQPYYADWFRRQGFTLYVCSFNFRNF